MACLVFLGMAFFHYANFFFRDIEMARGGHFENLSEVNLLRNTKSFSTNEGAIIYMITRVIILKLDVIDSLLKA